ncbi:MAG: hypothetical protein B6D61_00095 [Bacteroidetes bacterium 4484_249]|nr:MAG: hypothetical protein B6D61_00095 [Bacteroidetes bacterium 4484_249]
MANKEQLNQNPDNADKQIQEENSKSELNSESKSEEKLDQPVEKQEQNSKKSLSKEIAEEPETPAAGTDKESAEQPPKTEKKEEPAEEAKDTPEKTKKAPVKAKKKKVESVKKKEQKDAVETDDKKEPEKEDSEKSEVEKKPAKKAVKKKTTVKKKKEKVVVVEDEKEVEQEKEEKKPTMKEKNETSEEKPEVSKPETENAESSNQEKDTEEIKEVDKAEEQEEKPEENYYTLSRDELANLMEEIVKEDDINAIKRRVALIKVAFLKINKEEKTKIYEKFISEGGDENEFDSSDDDVEKRFNEAFIVYKQKRKIFLEEQEIIKQKNLEAKKIILEELKAMIDSEESLKKTYDEFKELQQKWKDIGMVPKNEVKDLWQSYHFFVEKFFDKVKINKELRDLDLKKNLEIKLGLCEKAEELLLKSSILESFKQLQKYHQIWKETGPAPQDKKDEIWERFKSITDKINLKRREHYEKLQENQKNNLIAKTALCENAEEILEIENTSIKEWQTKTDQINELLKVWKTIGSAPRKQNDEIWERFKTSLNTFFADKKEFFQKIKDEQINNYNLKLDLCTQAEAIKTSTDWRNTTQELINLQKEWKKIGPVPRKHSDKIWKRFRAACDEFFNNKSDYFSNIDKHEIENLKLKEELVKNIEAYKFKEDKNGNLDVLKEFQREWTNIGHVPIKEKDRIHNEFRSAINKQLDKLNISKNEIQTMNYMQRMEGLKDNPNAQRILSNERNFLMNKYKKLEEEINLWENNIGFFAASKKANLVKEEFEKKIDNAKNEMKNLKAKLKFLERETE